MMQVLRKLYCLSPVMAGFLSLNCAGVAIAGSALTEITPTALPQQSDPLAKAQVTSVSQLSDVQPTDWAFQALQSLVERYGVIAGYPDGRFRGNRALTRYEFAAGLNAALDRINELIAAGTADLVTKEDLATLQKLQEEFSAELATLRGRVDALEARTATLEAQQFSTTTKLNAEVIFALTGVVTGQDATGADIPRNTTLGYRTRLNFDTSFTGRDLLRTRLQSNNINTFSGPSGTNSNLPEGNLQFSSGPFESGSSEIGLDALLYSFPLGEKTEVVLEANAGAADDFTDTVNPYFDGDGGSGALSAFGTRNSIYYYIGGTGLALRHQFSDQLELSLGYLATAPNDPSASNGLFNGGYGALAQLTLKPSENLTFGLTYINGYNNDGSGAPGTGSLNANLAFATNSPVSLNAYGVQASARLSPGFVINGWAGYTAARAIGAGDADIWNYAIGLAFPDLGKQGNLAGIIVGMEPKVTASSIATLNRDRDTSFHIEGFYTYQISDNIAVTPGLIWLTAPNHDDRNADIVIGAIRTTFTF
ncbi:MAG: iron uptake porin [Leptolyngbyaceae bacterium]|nr:iron uptake porin [Leptolyngbyaceae bacterium]